MSRLVKPEVIADSLFGPVAYREDAPMCYSQEVAIRKAIRIITETYRGDDWDTLVRSLEVIIDGGHRYGRPLCDARRKMESHKRVESRHQNKARDPEKYRARQKVYFMRERSSGLIKIGISTNPKRRKGQVVHSGADVEILRVIEGGIDRERELHKKFSHIRVMYEWFKPDDELMAYIRNCETAYCPASQYGNDTHAS